MMAEPNLERPLPANPDAERAVLGAVLAGSEKYEVAFDRLTADDFFLSQHHRIFLHAAKLHTAGKPPDLLMIHDSLVVAGELEAAGGIGYLAQLGDDAHKQLHVEHYASIVKDKALLRRLIHVCHQSAERAFECDEEAEEILDRACESVQELAQCASTARDTGVTYRDAAGRLLLSLDEQPGIRVFTDLEKIDRLTGGFRAGELVIITADTGVGKTLFAQQIRRRACRDGWHALYSSAEMNAPQLVARELSSEAGVEHWKMRRPERISAPERDALLQAAARECVCCRILDGELSLSRVRLAARRMKAEGKLGLVVLDYDELIEAAGETEFDQQRNLARGAKLMAIQMQCPVILVSQLRKVLTGEDVKRPTLQRLYGSGAKAKHASVVIYVDREYVRELKGEETAARIAVLKNRDGRVGAFDARFNVRSLRFDSLPSEQNDAKDHKKTAAADV